MSDCTLPNGRAERVLTLADGVAGIITLAGGRAERVLTLADGTTCLPVLPPSGPVLPAWINYAWEADSLTLADGDPVASWVDVVGAVALAQTTPSLRPVYRATPSVESDGVDDVMTWAHGGALNVMLSGATYTIAWCGRWDDYGAGVPSTPIGNTIGSAVRGCAIRLEGRPSFIGLKFVHNSVGFIQATTAPITEIGDTLYHTVVCVAHGAGPPAKIYVDGTEVSSYSTRPNLAAAANPFPDWRIFSSSNGEPFDGKTNGVYIATTHAASAAEVLAFHDYRVAKGTL
jgi:hypothetical protein